MYIDGDILELDIEMDLEEVKALKEFVKDRLDYIEEIVLLSSNGGKPSTSSLFSLLCSLKITKPSLKIDAIDKNPMDLGSYGMTYWNAHE